MKFFPLIIFALCLMVSWTTFASDSEPPTGSIALLCKMSRHSQVMTQALSIDYDKKLANGAPATFTTSIISWTVEHDSKVEHHELNRITGTYYYWTDNETPAEPLPAFSCQKVSPKF